MSKITLSPNASGTGTFTIASPNGNTDRTLTLPDSSGTVATAESTLSQFNATGSAPVYACRAWVNFNGTGTVAIRASGNVSSITDSGTGDYTVNFTTAMPDANYAIHVNGAEGNANYARNTSVPYQSAPTASAFRFALADAGNALIDAAYVYAAVFR